MNKINHEYNEPDLQNMALGSDPNIPIKMEEMVLAEAIKTEWPEEDINSGDDKIFKHLTLSQDKLIKTDIEDHNIKNEKRDFYFLKDENDVEMSAVDESVVSDYNVISNINDFQDKPDFYPVKTEIYDAETLFKKESDVTCDLKFDHRHRVRIFVNKDIKTIQDLQNRITTVFNLTNFYLTSSSNEYLPPLEDVRILQNDETIWVIPGNQSLRATSFLSQHSRVSHIDSEDVPMNQSAIKACDNFDRGKTFTHLRSKRSSVEASVDFEDETVPKRKKSKRDKFNDAQDFVQQQTKNSESVENSVILKDETVPKKKKTSNDVQHHRKNSEAVENSVSLKNETVPKKKKLKRDKCSDQDLIQQEETNFGAVEASVNFKYSTVSKKKKEKRDKFSDALVFVPQEKKNSEVQSELANAQKKKRKDQNSDHTTVIQETANEEAYKSGDGFGNSKKIPRSNNVEILETQSTENENLGIENPSVCMDALKKIVDQNLEKASDDLMQTDLVSKIDNAENMTNGMTGIKDKTINNAGDDMVCQGNLSNYKKKVNVQTNTEEYLKKKKINIVKIELVRMDDILKKYAASPGNKEPTVVVHGCVEPQSQRSSITSTVEDKTSLVQMHDILKKFTAVPENNVPSIVVNGCGEPQSQTSSTIPTEDDKRSLIRNTTPIEFAPDTVLEMQSDSNTTGDDLKAVIQKFRGNRKKRTHIFHTPERYKIQNQEPPLVNNEFEESMVADNVKNIDCDIPKSPMIDNVNIESIDKLHDSGLASSEISHVIVEDESKNKVQDDGANGVICPEENLVDGTAENLQSTMDTTYDISPIHPPSQISASISSISGMETPEYPKNVNTMLLSGLSWLSGASKHLRSKMVSGVGDTIQRLKDNSIAISPRSPCMSEHNDGSSDEKQSLSIIDVDADISQTSGKASNCGEDNIESKEPNKRKRRRTRKRKSNRPIATDSPAVQTYLPPSRSNVNFTKGCPSMHIKFVENPDDSSLMVVDAVNEETKTELDIQSITIESDTEEIEIKIENIMKSPLMNELLPKAGDIISFKILKMSENYCPEVSPYITAKVKSFRNDDYMVTLEIINGLAHFELPAGKLNVDSKEDRFLDNIREMCWSDLIETRLLFP